LRESRVWLVRLEKRQLDVFLPRSACLPRVVRDRDGAVRGAVTGRTRVSLCLAGAGDWGLGGKGVEMVRLEDLARGREEQPARARGEWVAEEVGAIPKNKREAVVVRLVSRDGRRFVDVREFYWARDAGEYRPSKQGVALDVSLLPELLTLLEEAGRKAGA